MAFVIVVSMIGLTAAGCVCCGSEGRVVKYRIRVYPGKFRKMYKKMKISSKSQYWKQTRKFRKMLMFVENLKKFDIILKIEQKISKFS